MKQYYISLPDNEDAFYAYINLVINNKKNAHIPKEVTTRPSKIGWVKVSYTRNECRELFIIVGELKEKVFVEMIIDQFTLLRTHFNLISSLVRFENSDRY